jgi:hypothetical protein
MESFLPRALEYKQLDSISVNSSKTFHGLKSPRKPHPDSGRWVSRPVQIETLHWEGSKVTIDVTVVTMELYFLTNMFVSHGKVKTMLNFKLKYVLFTVLGCSTFVLRVRIP